MTTKAIHDPRYRALVNIIAQARKAQGVSQADLGRRMCLSRQTVQKIESVEVRLDLVRYVVLCRILGLNAGQLLSRLEEPSDEDDPLYLSDRARRLSGLRSHGNHEFGLVQIFVRLFVRQREESPVNIGESHGFKSYPRYQFQASVLLEKTNKTGAFLFLWPSPAYGAGML